jgi:glycosyltransferase involved in cell wall biosynthesis
MGEPRILYHCPDWPHDPIGGILCIYRHVEALRRRGFAAWLLHERSGVRASWFSHDAAILYREEGEGPRPGDFLVVPEGCRDLMIENAGKPWATDVFAQSWIFIFDALRPGESWRHWGVRSAITVSRYVRRFLRESMGIRSSIVHPSLDLSLFRPGRKRMQIAYMPRKHPSDLRKIEAIFRLRFPEFGAVPFVPINGEPHVRVAEILAESAVFLASGYPEGCPLPPLEAMACGCLVVGFAGRGGLEYMRHRQNCWIAGDGDLLAAAVHLGAALRAAEAGEDAAMRERARRTAEEFSPEAEEEALARYWRRRLREGAA